MKKTLALILSLCMVLTLFAVLGVSAADAESSTYTMTAFYDSGKYSVTLKPGDSVTISTAEELNLFSEAVNTGHTPLLSDITYLLKKDITLNSGTFSETGVWSMAGTPVEFTAIGSATNPFISKFNGNGYAIKGLVSKSDTNAGLFGYIKGANIYNVTIENALITGSSALGTVVGAMNGGTLTNVKVIGAVLNGTDLVGGLVGQSVKGDIATSISDSAVDAVITATGKDAGGVIGSGEDGTIRNLRVLGSVSANEAAGGLVGTVTDAFNLMNSHVAAKVSATTAKAGGIVGDIASGTLANCLASGKVTGASEAGALVGKNVSATATTCYFLKGTPAGIAGTSEVSEADLATQGLLSLLNSVLGKEETALYYAWTIKDGAITLADTLPIASVKVNSKTSYAASLDDAALLARASKDSIVTLLRDCTITGGEIGGDYTIDLHGYTITLESALILSIGTLTITDSQNNGTTDSLNNGLITTDTGSAVIMRGGSLKLTGGKIASTASFALQNIGSGSIYLSGNCYLSGIENADLYIGQQGTLFGYDGNETYYSGERIVGVICGFALKDGLVIVQKAPEGKFYLRDYDNEISPYAEYGYMVNEENVDFIAKWEGEDLVLKKYAKFSWWIIAALFVAAISLIVVTTIRTRRHKEKMKLYTMYSVAPIFPLIAFTGLQIGFLIAAAACALISLLVMLISNSVQQKAEEKAKANSHWSDEKPEDVAEDEVEEEAEEEVEEEAEEEYEEEAEEEYEEEAEEEYEEEAEEEYEEAEEEYEEVEEYEEGEEGSEEEAEIAAKISINSLYDKSFEARIILSDTTVKARYSEIKNALLSYNKVGSRMSWGFDAFHAGRKTIAKITMRGKTPCLYLALDPAELEGTKYNVTDAGTSKKYSTVPCLMRLKSDRAVKWSVELIDMLAEKEGLEKNTGYTPTSYAPRKLAVSTLLKKGLIKKNK